MLTERQLPPLAADSSLLARTLTTMLMDREKLRSVGESARSLARPDAAERIAARLIELAKHRSAKA
jgi:UDP-N-acetylglucosamine:LPS N-acetylglucosamine transferase